MAKLSNSLPFCLHWRQARSEVAPTNHCLREIADRTEGKVRQSIEVARDDLSTWRQFYFCKNILTAIPARQTAKIRRSCIPVANCAIEPPKYPPTKNPTASNAATLISTCPAQ